MTGGGGGGGGSLVPVLDPLGYIFSTSVAGGGRGGGGA